MKRPPPSDTTVFRQERLVLAHHRTVAEAGGSGRLRDAWLGVVDAVVLRHRHVEHALCLHRLLVYVQSL